MKLRIPVAPVVLPLLLLSGCAVSGMPDRTVQADTQPLPEVAGTGADTLASRPDTVQAEPYDLEAEMLEEDRLKEDDVLEEKIKPLSPDSFNVKEEEAPVDLTESYGLGYRVQVFASADRSAAAEQRKIIMAGTGIAAYIEYEDGLYKVRVGDFQTRSEAAQARARISETYPDCWIVRTTVKK